MIKLRKKKDERYGRLYCTRKIQGVSCMQCLTSIMLPYSLLATLLTKITVAKAAPKGKRHPILLLPILGSFRSAPLKTPVCCCCAPSPSHRWSSFKVLRKATPVSIRRCKCTDVRNDLHRGLPLPRSPATL